MKKQSWLTYNDLDVSRTQEAAVQRDRDRSGYIFFYMHKWVIQSVALSLSGRWESDFNLPQEFTQSIKKNLFFISGT